MSKPQALLLQQKKKWIEFLNHNFGYESDQSYEIDFAPIVDDANIKNTRVIFENEKIISSAALYPRTLVVNHRPVLHIGIVGAVATDESHRGRGYSKLILEEIERMAVEQNLDGLVLWSDQKDFYNRLGFVEFGKQVIYSLSTITKPEHYKDGFIEKKWSSKEIETLYMKHSSRIEREPKYWAEISKITSCQRAQWVERASGKILAYLAYDRGKDMQGIIHEWGGDLFALQALVYETVVELSDQGRDLFWLTSPILQEDPVLELLEEKNILIDQGLGFFKPLKKIDLKLLEKTWFWGLDSL